MMLIACDAFKKNSGEIIPKTKTISEETREISMKPMVDGSLINR
jgi:hypothetical protein